MKLKSKDEIIVKLIDKLEEQRFLDNKLLNNNNDVNLDETFKVLGEVIMLKWILGIPTCYDEYYDGTNMTEGDTDA